MEGLFRLYFLEEKVLFKVFFKYSVKFIVFLNLFCYLWECNYYICVDDELF